MNKKLLILFLFTISETFFMCLISFVCGYSFRYYLYDLLRPKNMQKKFYNFFQLIIENMDSLTQTLEKLNINDEYYSGENLSNESDF